MTAFDIPAERLSDAIVAFALQSGASVGSLDLDRCRARSSSVQGRMSRAAALQRLLAGSGCTFVQPAPFTYRIVPATAAATDPAPGAPPAPSQLEEVVLTAPKLSGLVGRLPYAVDIVPGGALERSRAADVAAMALETAGLAVTNLGAGRNKILLRGLADGPISGRTQATVGTYLDNVRVNFDAPDPDLLLVDIEQVEVLRGPQGALYGSGSIGGIYRIVTRKPDLQETSLKLSAAAGVTGHGEAAGGADAVLNAPLAPGRLAVRLVAYDERQPGYLDNPALGLDDVNRVRRRGLRGATRLALGERWTATLSGMHQTIRADDAQYTAAPIVTGGGRAAGSGAGARTTAIPEPYDNDIAAGSLAIEGRTGWGRISSSTAILQHRLSSRFDATGGRLAVARAFDQSQHKDSLVEELTLASLPGGALKWTLGAFAARGTEHAEEQLSQTDGTAAYRELRDDDITEAALYGEVGWAITPAIMVTGGLRGARFQRRVRSLSIETGASRPFAETLVDQSWAPKLVLELRPAASTTLYLQAAEGYRPGGLNTGGLASDGSRDADRRYGSDELWSYEAGVKTTALSGRARLQAAVYRTVWRNLQSDQILPSGLTYTRNIGRATNLGFEAQALVQASRRLTLRAGVAVNAPHVDANIETRRETDTPLPIVSGLNLQGGADYQRPLAPGVAGFVTLRGQYVGDYSLTFDTAGQKRSGGHASARLTAGAETAAWRASVYVENPMDARGDTFGFGNPFSFRTTVQRTPQRPRTFGVSLSAAF